MAAASELSNSPEAGGASESHEPFEPIAIIGMSCRLPGNVRSPSDLWRLLMQGRMARSKVPLSRFNIDGFHPIDISSQFGFFLEEDVRQFDNTFFGINSLEAAHMDPQQRKLLELVFECFENANYTLQNLAGKNVGCFVGNFTNDFQMMQSKDPEFFSRYTATGFGPSLMANRISHIFDLHGPSMTVDTACSSSLYSLHLACSALQRQECEAAICASANLILSPEVLIGASKSGIISPTSACHTFDASADGYARGEGVGALFLKTLSSAKRDGDRIRAIIRGTAVNSNGRTRGVSLPSAQCQQRVIEKAYAVAGLRPSDVDYVEAHGTGTPVGDPVEVCAISRAFLSDRAKPILIGSVKPNMGHGEGVSGITSLIKGVLILEHGIVPPTVGITDVNPELKLEERNVRIVRQPTKLHVQSPKLSINSFGYGGANAHCILEREPDGSEPVHCSDAGQAQHERLLILPLSAQSPKSLKHMASAITEMVHEDKSLDAAANTLTCHKSDLKFRGLLTAEYQPASGQKHCVKFSDLITLDSFPDLQPLSHTKLREISFVFTGQGVQWRSMASKCLKLLSSFKQTIQFLDKELQSTQMKPPWRLEDLIESEDQDIDSAQISQPLCVAVQIGLVEQFREWGIDAESVIGHSSGEIAAAFATGFLTATEAIIVAFCRGLAVTDDSISTAGAMLAVACEWDSASKIIHDLGLHDRIFLACANSPRNVTLSGDCGSIMQLKDVLLSRQIFHRELATDGQAYHSLYMLAAEERYAAHLSSSGLFQQDLARGNVSSPTMVSSVTGQPITRSELRSIPYWCRNLRSTVYFEKAVTKVMGNGPVHFIEIGPHSALKPYIFETRDHLGLKGDDVAYSSSLIRNRDSSKTLVDVVCRLYLLKQGVSLERFNKILNGRVIDLPPYPWSYSNSECYEPSVSKRFRDRSRPRHELLGSPVSGCDTDVRIWRNRLDVEQVLWLQDHKLGQIIILPGAAHIAMAIEALSQVVSLSINHDTTISLRQIRIINALQLSMTVPIEIFTELRTEHMVEQHQNRANAQRWWSFKVCSSVHDKTTIHAHGMIRILDSEQGFSPANRDVTRHLLELRKSNIWYEKLAAVGLCFGRSFQLLKEVRNDLLRGSYQALSSLNPISDSTRGSRYPLIHPTVIDALFQTGIIASTAGCEEKLRCKVPVAIDEMIISGSASQAQGAVKTWAVSYPRGLETVDVDAQLLNEKHDPIIDIKGLRLHPFAAGLYLQQLVRSPESALGVRWKPDILIAGDLPKGRSHCGTERLEAQSTGSAPINERLLMALDLLMFKQPAAHVLLVGWTLETDVLSAMEALQANEYRANPSTFTLAWVQDEGSLAGCDLKSQLASIKEGISNHNPSALSLGERKFDIVVHASGEAPSQNRYVDILTNSLATAVWIYGPSSSIREDQTPREVSFYQIEDDKISVSRPKRTSPAQEIQNTNIIVVRRPCDQSFGGSIASAVSKRIGVSVVAKALHDVDTKAIQSSDLVIVTLELEEGFLVNVDDEQMTHLKRLLCNCPRLIWLTGAAPFVGGSPDLALASGLLRALISEQPSLNYVMMGFDAKSTSESQAALSNVSQIAHKLLCHDTDLEAEYLQHRGTLYLNRVVPISTANSLYKDKTDASVTTAAIKDAEQFHLAIRHTGQFDTLYFQGSPRVIGSLDDNILEVEVKAVSINAKDVYVMSAKVDTSEPTCALELAGVVIRSNSRDFHPGDRIVSMMPHRFRKYEQVPAWSAQRLEHTEDFETPLSMLMVFSTAIYALRHRAQLQPGETVLVHSGAGAVGQAAIQIAHIMGADVYTTVGSAEKKKFLMVEYGVPEARIFDSHDPNFARELRASTESNGVDVVLNSLTDDLLSESWNLCNEFGRFVEIGKRNITNGSRLDMERFRDGTTFTAFDLTSLFYSRSSKYRQIWGSLTAEVLQLYRTRRIQPVKPTRCFDVSQIHDAFRYFQAPGRIGKVVVTLQDPESLIQFMPSKYSTSFDAHKTYILFGCLGGVGRAITRWMFQQGARNLVFLSRSGTSKPEAAALVETLERMNVQVEVVRGDVGVLNDVQTAIHRARKPIGGIVQASMSLKDTLFSAMSIESWSQVMDPKVVGTWNIHKALHGYDNQLDFFLMTSSKYGTVGHMTQSNYCAANAFLDAFAAYRQGLGLPATSLALGMISGIGILHDRPDVQASLSRKGVRAISEEEMLVLCDFALQQQFQRTRDREQGLLLGTDGEHSFMNEAHILTGFELRDTGATREQFLEANDFRPNDPRANILTALHSHTQSDRADPSGQGAVSDSLHEIIASGDRGRLSETVYKAFAERIGTVLDMPAAQVTAQSRLADMGFDSMVGAELKAWAWRALGVDLPFSVFLENGSTLEGLISYSCEELVKGRKSQ